MSDLGETELGSGLPRQEGRPALGAILVIEDDPVVRDGVSAVLRREGYDVLVAEDGRAGLELAMQYQPALVLLDMRLPYLSGWEVAEAMAERGCTAPVVVMAAAREAQDWATAIAADACLAKPFGRMQLLELVRRLLPRP